MTAFLYGFGDFCTSIFSFLPKIGLGVDLLFVFLGFAGTAAWIWYMNNKRAEEKGLYEEEETKH
jgi:hypothetical protein